MRKKQMNKIKLKKKNMMLNNTIERKRKQMR